MMLHRHFEAEKSHENVTTLADLNRAEEPEKFVSEVFPPDEPVEKPKRGRKKATKTE